MSETFAPSNFTRKGFIYSKEELLIPDPVNEKEKYKIAKGKRDAQLKNK
jgi:NADH-quinone oxidoreductase subunit I